MLCNEWRDSVQGWLNTEEQHLELLAHNDTVTLQRINGGVLFSVQLIQQWPGNVLLDKWRRSGQNPLNHFQGALAQDPATGYFWLLQWTVGDSHSDTLLPHLEALLNQRKTWRSMARFPILHNVAASP